MAQPKSPPKARVPSWIYLCIVITGLLALGSLYFRYRVEDRNKAVGLCAEIDVIQGLASSQGLSLDDALRQLKSKGLTAVVIPEQYVAEIEGDGLVQVKDGTYVIGPSEVMNRVLRGVKMRFPNLVQNESFAGSSQGDIAIKFPDISMIRGVAIGLNPDLARSAQVAGLMIVARCANPPSANDSTVDDTLAWAKELGAKAFLPEGEQVLGRRNALDTMIQSLRSHDMWYVSPEFAKIGGDENVVEKAPDLVVRLHSAQTQELDKLTFEEAVDRYSRAARERNQRLLLLRPVSSAGSKPLDDFADFMDKVGKETIRQGGVIGDPHPFEESQVPRPLFPLLGLSIVPVAIWSLAQFLRRKAWLIVAAILFAGLGAACWLPHARPFMALFAAIVYPTAAFLVLDRRAVGRAKWPVEYLFTTLISFVGGLAVAGLLNSLAYFIHAQQFMGVKFAHFAPIALVGAYFYYRFGLLRKSLSEPVEWGRAFLALVVLGALAFMISRTGNDNPAGVSGVELKARNLLDVILFVRPRTKEFLIGHPFLILGIGMMLRSRNNRLPYVNWNGWITLFIMLGAIGQTSIVNTMCHIHTPLTISLARLGVGFIAGGIIGAAVWVLVDRSFRRFVTAEG